jgi:hypothetical protein
MASEMASESDRSSGSGIHDPLVIFKACIMNMQSDEHVQQIILDRLRLLVGAPCRLNRRETLDLPVVQGTIHRFDASKNDQGYRFRADVRDNTTGLVMRNSKLVVKWIYQYGRFKNKDLRLIGSGWQEITLKLHAPYHPLADPQGHAWFPLSCILSKELRNLSRAVLFEWLTSLFPLEEHRTNTRERATAFLLTYARQLECIDPSLVYNRALAITANAVARDDLEEQQVKQTLLHMKKSISRNQAVTRVVKRKRKAHGESDDEDPGRDGDRATRESPRSPPQQSASTTARSSMEIVLDTQSSTLESNVPSSLATAFQRMFG